CYMASVFPPSCYAGHCIRYLVFFLLLPLPPSSPLFPYTTLFRSRLRGAATDPRVGVDDRRGPRLRRHRLVADHAARARRHRRRPRRQSPELAPGENPMNVLEINNLNVAYSHQVVHDVSLSVKAGETVALVGESGS